MSIYNKFEHCPILILIRFNLIIVLLFILHKISLTKLLKFLFIRTLISSLLYLFIIVFILYL